MAAQDNFSMDGDDLNFGEDRSSSPTPDNENDLDYEDELMEDFELEGYADLADDGDELYNDSPVKSRPAFYHRSNKAAERSALRTRVDESDSFLLIEDSNHASTPAPNARTPKFTRRRRGKNTLPDFSKKVSGELDSDDDMMMTMREKGYSDQQIAEKLVKEGRKRYDRKSVSTRISRIKFAQAAQVDTQLEEGYKEWTMDDDMRLMEAYNLADIQVNYEIERVRAWRFRKVSDTMRKLDKDSIYSEKACRERYQALIDGTARIPTEEDDNPDARRAELEQFRMEREDMRAKERAEKEKKEALDRKIKEDAKLRQAQKSEETALARAAKAEAKAQRAMQRAAQNQMRLERAHENKLKKSGKLESMRREKAELAQKVSDANSNEKVKVNMLADLKNVTGDTKDPRSVLTLEDLQALCGQRALDPEGRSKEELVQRLKDADDKFSAAQLKNMCRAKGLNVAGTKILLKYQIALVEARKFPSFDEALLAADEEEEEGDGDEVTQDVNNEPIDLLQGADDDEDEIMFE
ncbi:hypothetical protein K491DRAFT_701233 [Lophiostoma macrostomum CBS 122681]|uniref:SAP domain-containing protein n=1 Tax=Lophiostoma macrostomum CBS 122681 TaxID=1314788 RepID=A0A6A6TPX9_9PLEO|nr:hypothetical protein K491DRAFT_701233 [Lophiostoma macrostomum CBS 122681]